MVFRNYHCQHLSPVLCPSSNVLSLLLSGKSSAFVFSLARWGKSYEQMLEIPPMRCFGWPHQRERPEERGGDAERRRQLAFG
jgi:hypothetical protein